eukprot:scaffold13844_cov55-Attheya_sp.AAC.7
MFFRLTRNDASLSSRGGRQRSTRTSVYQARVVLLSVTALLLAVQCFIWSSFVKRHNENGDSSSSTSRSRTSITRSSPEATWCGDWTSKGNLGNPQFDPFKVEPIDSSVIPSCGGNTAVGTESQPDSALLFCNPPLGGGDRARNMHRDHAVLALDIRKRQAPDDHENETPEYSLVSPSHNVAEVLKISVPLLCQHTVGRWEVVFVLDQSYDESLQVLRNVLLSDTCMQNTGFIRARVLVQPTSIFETSSDNLGFLLANPLSRFYVEIQSDMLVAETGWNRDMARPTLQYGDIFAVGGRCGHGIGGPRYSLGRCGANFGSLNDNMRQEDIHQLRITATVNRGPILFRADVLREFKFLDEVNFHQGDDEHDLFRRAHHKGWYAAYRYAHIYSPLNLSPVREAKFNKKTPPEGAQQSHWYSVFRKELNNATCDPNVPLKSFAMGLLPKKPVFRPLDPLPQGVNLKTLPLSPFPARS